MSKSKDTKLDILGYIFNGTPISWGAATHLQINLHNSDPAEEGIATNFSSTYGGYAPVVVVRTAEGFTLGDPTTNAVDLLFPQCTSGSDVITHISVSPEGFEQIILYGALAIPRIVTAGVQPEFKVGTLSFKEL